MRWIGGRPARKSIGAPAMVRVLTRAGAGRRRSPPASRPGNRRSGWRGRRARRAPRRARRRSPRCQRPWSPASRRASRVKCVDTAQAGRTDRLDLALLRAVVDDRGRVARLRRDDERRHEGAARGLAEAPEQREWRAQDDLVRSRCRRLAPQRDVPQARAVRRDVERRPAAGQRARPVLADPCGGRPPGGHRAHGNVGTQRRRSSVDARGGSGRRSPRAGRHVRPLERQRPGGRRYGRSARSPERAHPRRSRRSRRSA